MVILGVSFSVNLFIRFVIRESMSDKLVITKVGDTSPPPPPPTGAGKKPKTMKTFPRGVLKHKTLKIKAVSDPAKPPPLKKSMRNHTIRLITDKGENRHRKTIKRRISKMSDKQVDEMVTKHKLLKSPNTPPKLKREMLKGAMLAGFISS
jgi:hypothetical protein